MSGLALDPRLYKLADGSYNNKRIKSVIDSYAEKLQRADIFVNDVPVVKRQLELVVPKGFCDTINDIKILNKSIIKITEL